MPEFHSDNVFKALEFAAEKHAGQRRKGTDNIPYINHPIRVTSILARNVDNIASDVLVASLLHDTLEDTKTTYEEIQENFGKNVADWVLELTDDMNLPYNKRKQKQIEEAVNLSHEARMIKIADKTSNIQDILTTKLLWSRQRKRRYIDWAEQVINACGDVDENLEKLFREVVRQGREAFGG